MRRALCVGIDDYKWNKLSGCVNDANGIAESLETHYNGTPNFHVTRLTSDQYEVTKAQLFRSIRELFAQKADVAIFFFSGHGGDSDIGGYLVTQDGQKHDMGVALNELIELANLARHINEIIIIIDACHSGHAGNTNPLMSNIASLREGVSVLASSLQNQYSMEKNGQGVFTSVLLEALNAGASDVMGQITVAGIYNYADKVLGPWQQRPVFKTHLTQLNTIKYTEPDIPFEQLRLLDDYFKDKNHQFALSPAYEPTAEPRDPEKEKVFAHLQSFTSSNLVEPVGEKHMYYAAMHSKYCQLTPLGKLYRQMVLLDKI